MKRKVIISSLSIIVILVVTAFIVRSCGHKKDPYTVETVKVFRGNVVNTVTATGTLEALKTVEVGTQVSGVISKLYADYNSHVKKGELLAELDKTPLIATLSNAQASLDDAKAELNYISSKYQRVKLLYDKQMVAQNDYDEALYSFSKANAAMKIAKSNFDKAKINLAYATIYSPIDGVVLSREVSEGQTVAANFSAPTLFRIANDLTKMQVEANIDEADIGLVKQNQSVEFTVDAFPDLKFKGKVTEIRLQSTITSNVVTYTVIVEAENPEMKLMPGMTANISINVEEADGILCVPTKAIQLRLDSATLTGYYKSLPPQVRKEVELPPAVESKKKNDGLTSHQAKVWVKRGQRLKSLIIEIGASDDANVEVKSGLQEGDEVLTGISKTEIKSSGEQSRSPFMPTPPKGHK